MKALQMNIDDKRSRAIKYEGRVYHSANVVLKLAEIGMVAIERDIEKCSIKTRQVYEDSPKSWIKYYCKSCLAQGYCKWTIGEKK